MTQLRLASWTPGPGSEVDPECTFINLTHTKQLFFVPFYDTTSGIEAELKCDYRHIDVRTEEHTDLNSEIIIQIESKAMKA